MTGISKYPKANLEDYNLKNPHVSKSFARHSNFIIGQNEIEMSDNLSSAIGDLKSIKKKKEKVKISSRVNDYCDEDLTKVGVVPNLGNINNLSRFKADMDSYSQNVNI